MPAAGAEALDLTSFLAVGPSRPDTAASPMARARFLSWRSMLPCSAALSSLLRPLPNEARAEWRSHSSIALLRGVYAMWRGYQAMATKELRRTRHHRHATVVGPASPSDSDDSQVDEHGVPLWITTGHKARFPPSLRLHHLARQYRREEPKIGSCNFHRWCKGQVDVGSRDCRRLWLSILAMGGTSALDNCRDEDPVEPTPAGAPPATRVSPPGRKPPPHVVPLAAPAPAAAPAVPAAPAASALAAAALAAATPAAVAPNAVTHAAAALAAAEEADHSPPPPSPTSSDPLLLEGEASRLDHERLAALAASAVPPTAMETMIREARGAAGVARAIAHAQGAIASAWYRLCTGTRGWSPLSRGRESTAGAAALQCLYPGGSHSVGPTHPFNPPASSLGGWSTGDLFSDEIVNAWLWVIAARTTDPNGRGRVYAIPSLTTSKLLNTTAIPLSEEAWRAHALTQLRRRRRMALADVVLLPVFWEPAVAGGVGHWAMMRVNTHARSIVIADSMSATHPARTQAALNRAALLLNLHLERDGSPPRVWSTSVAPATQQGQNGTECGPLACAAVLPLLLGSSWTPFCQTPAFRSYLAYTLRLVAGDQEGDWHAFVAHAWAERLRPRTPPPELSFSLMGGSLSPPPCTPIGRAPALTRLARGGSVLIPVAALRRPRPTACGFPPPAPRNAGRKRCGPRWSSRRVSAPIFPGSPGFLGQAPRKYCNIYSNNYVVGR
jgi:hypothetical protein